MAANKNISTLISLSCVLHKPRGPHSSFLNYRLSHPSGVSLLCLPRLYHGPVKVASIITQRGVVSIFSFCYGFLHTFCVAYDGVCLTPLRPRHPRRFGLRLPPDRGEEAFFVCGRFAFFIFSSSPDLTRFHAQSPSYPGQFSLPSPPIRLAKALRMKRVTRYHPDKKANKKGACRRGIFEARNVRDTRYLFARRKWVSSLN